jgi:hypothetical protein
MDQDSFDLERKLAAGRSEPRDGFVTALAGEVRGASGRARQSRIGLMLALCGLIVVAVASFGGVGYASSSGPKSAAQAQYTRYTPKVTKSKPASVQHVQVAGQSKAANAAPKVKSGQLPFTGLALWIPLAGGILLIGTGLLLRTRGRRNTSGAH